MKTIKVQIKITCLPHLCSLVASQTFRPLTSVTAVISSKNEKFLNCEWHPVKSQCVWIKSLCFGLIFFSWSFIFIHEKLNPQFLHQCHTEWAQEQCPVRAISNSSTDPVCYERLEGQHTAWQAGSFTAKLLCRDKASVSGNTTDALQTYRHD